MVLKVFLDNRHTNISFVRNLDFSYFQCRFKVAVRYHTMWTFIGFGISVGLLLNIASGDLIDANSTIYSEACKLTDASCANSFNKSNACTSLKSNSTIECYVKIGFCTEKEFANLTSEICNETKTEKTPSSAKINFYNAFDKNSISCKKQGAYCIRSSVLSIVFKQQEQYCYLMTVDTTNGTSESCLRNGATNCTMNEFTDLKAEACKFNYTYVNPFAEALWKTSAKCKSKISECANRSAGATQMVIDERYCDSLTLNMGGTAETCFKETDACTAEEVSRLRVSTCGPDVTSPTPGTTLTTRSAATTQAWNIYVKILFFTLTCSLNRN